MMNFKGNSLGYLALFILFASELATITVQAEEYAVLGIVRDKRGDSIQGITVEIQRIGDAPPIGFPVPMIVESTYTDTIGSYSISVEVTTGYTYDLVFKKQGYQTKRFEDYFSEIDTSTVQDAALNRVPIVEINGPYEASVDEFISYSSEGTFDPDGDKLSFLWTFGDGNSDSAANPTHSYLVASAYTVILSVEDSEGAKTTVNTTCQVGDPSPLVENNGPYVGEKNKPVQFSSEGSHDPVGYLVTYAWSFGDDDTSDEENPVHVYTEVGIYHVELEVTNSRGIAASTVTRCKITGDPPISEINGPYQGTVEEAVVFSADGSYAAGRASIVDYRWEFGDGSSSSYESPQHNYLDPGEYTVTLNVTDDLGQTTASITTCIVTNVDEGESGFRIPGFPEIGLVLGLVATALLIFRRLD